LKQTIQLNNGRRFEIVGSNVPITNDLVKSVTGVLEGDVLQTLAWGPITGSDKGCIMTALCANYDAKGHITLTCPTTGIAAGGSFTISVTATNDNTVSAVYIIGIATSPTLIPTSFPSGGSASQSPPFKLAAGATSASYSWVYTMPTPAVNISVVSNLSSDPDQNCT